MRARLGEHAKAGQEEINNGISMARRGRANSTSPHPSPDNQPRPATPHPRPSL